MDGRKFVVVLASVGVLAAGCGTKTAQAVSLTAAVTRTAGQTARIAVTTTMQMQSMSVSFTQTGVFDFTHSRGMISMQDPVGMTEVFMPPTAYIRLSGDAGGTLPHGKSWVAVPAGMSEGPEGSMLSPIGGGTDPADLLASLTAISNSVTSLGSTTTRGVPVTRFRVEIDPAKAAERVPSWERASFLGFTKSLGSGTIPVDVWVDKQNLVRQVKLSLSGGLGGPASGRMVEVTDFYDFGVPVRVSAPPASQTASMSQLITNGSSAAGAGGSSSPPRVSGTLSAAQAAAAERVVAAFWLALGRDDAAAVARTVPPAQRSCVQSFLNSGGPKITVSSFRVVSAEPAGNRKATVGFTVKAQASLDGQNIPVFPPGSGHAQWLVTIKKAGHWYVDLERSTALAFAGACP
jgi:hypothetical protein